MLFLNIHVSKIRQKVVLFKKFQLEKSSFYRSGNSLRKRLVNKYKIYICRMIPNPNK